jgi:hypothetical protein
MAHYATDSFLMIILDPNKLHPFTKKVLEEVVGINLEQGLPTLSGKLSFEVEYKEGGCSQDIEWTNFFDQVLEGDIPMLELVENPICFNPNAQLYRIAKLNKWKIIVERKDVIYEIQ